MMVSRRTQSTAPGQTRVECNFFSKKQFAVRLPYTLETYNPSNNLGEIESWFLGLL